MSKLHSSLTQQRRLDPIYQNSEVRASSLSVVKSITGVLNLHSEMFCSCDRDADPVLQRVLQLPALVNRGLCAVFFA